MRVIFLRVADHEPGIAVVTRDDGVTYHFHGGPVSVALPHDIVHFAVEDELGIADGIWGAIAGGVVFSSMTHVSGRRPPHAAERSAELIRTYRDCLQRAELIGGVAERVAAGRLDVPGLPEAFASQVDGGLGAEAVLRAARRLRAEAKRWARCPVGGQVAFDWPAHRRMRIDVARRSVHRDPASRSRPARAARAARAR